MTKRKYLKLLKQIEGRSVNTFTDDELEAWWRWGQECISRTVRSQASPHIDWPSAPHDRRDG